MIMFYQYMYNTFQRKYRNILINANSHVTIIILQSFKVGGIILCEIMPYFQKIMSFLEQNETALYTFAYK